MNDELTATFTQPCAQCSAVNWAVSDEGRFYCRSCHNVAERTEDVVDTTFTPGSARISNLTRRSRTRTPDRQWWICEGFQFILKNQADALVDLGVSAHFRDQVLCQLWRLYLQKSRQAFTSDPIRSSAHQLRITDSDVDSEGSGSDWSGVLGNSVHLSESQRQVHTLMNMRRTLALIHLALVWSRAPLTLSDVIMLVRAGLLPYTDVYEKLPDKLKVEGVDVLTFRVHNVPSHQELHTEAQALVHFLQLETFPPISSQSQLHPALLSLRYLSDANLPDQLHPWLLHLMKRAAVEDQTLYTFDSTSCPVLPQHDIQTVAIIIVTIKVVFGLNDCTEWDLCDVDDQSEAVFSLRRWFRLTQAALRSAEQSRNQLICRTQWKSGCGLYQNRRSRSLGLKRKRTSDQVQRCFQNLSSPVAARRCSSSSFRFCWGGDDGADGPSLHHQKLTSVLTMNHNMLTPTNATYWLPARCTCYLDMHKSHFQDMKAWLPHSFLQLLNFFSFLIDVKPTVLFQEVLNLERRLLGHNSRTRTKTRTRTLGQGTETAT
ncbi:TATA box-binding protein-associated factor RNA polymerase I subunit B isoform X2 [Cynoglossus semilaevis]|uniref:TATA box-binding protein-associated factor RNA polymerase I subunit B isoform X2 n=1 Tax=Cynoglossus semilaevis TaxID=244447 RepID=UPI0007DC9390|nr:TATA box-binding protein-associated factor RNA polymerase I subunit B isoform X2 [Cynoglossus semilaevis]